MATLPCRWRLQVDAIRLKCIMNRVVPLGRHRDVNTHTHTYTHTYTHTHTPIHTHTHTGRPSREGIETYTYIHTHTHVYMHSHTHTHIQGGTVEKASRREDLQETLQIDNKGSKLFKGLQAEVFMICAFTLMICALQLLVRVVTLKQCAFNLIRKDPSCY